MICKTHDEISEVYLKATLAHDADSIAELYPDDCVLYGPAGEGYTKEYCRETFKKMFETFKVESFDWDDKGELVGDVAYHWGTWKMVATLRATGDRVEINARTVDVRKKQPDGSWKMIIDHASVAIPGAL